MRVFFYCVFGLFVLGLWRSFGLEPVWAEDPPRNPTRVEAGDAESVTSIDREATEWTLDRSVRRVLEIAPEMRSAQAELQARKGRLSQAGVWPNPEIELRGDDKIGKDAGDGGVDFTQFALHQPLPLGGRLGVQRELATAELHGAQADLRFQQLLLEGEVARRFHTLQLTAALFRLAEQRLQFAAALQEVGRRRERAGELAKLERLRLDVVRESAQQILDNAEGKFGEAVSRFSSFLGLSLESPPIPVPLEGFGSVPDLEVWRSSLAQHPALLSAKHQLDASRAGVELVRKERLPDPVLRFYREQDFLDGRRQHVNGIGIGMTVPLWDRKSGRLREARAQVDLSQSTIEVLERDLKIRIRQSHLHLSHLVEQEEHFRTKVLEPARAVFELTRKAYGAGEMEILALIDANNTYFDAQERYLELIWEAWLEAAELRKAAGYSLMKTIKDADHE